MAQFKGVLDNLGINELDRNGVIPMMDVKQTPPDRMTSEQRREEVATLLARGVARLHMPQTTHPQNPSTESEFELAIPPGRSVHGDPNNQRMKGSK